MAGDTIAPESNELRSLIQKRGQVKGKLTRFNSFLESLSENSNLTQLKLRMQKLENILTEFEEIQAQIEEHDLSDSQEERESFETLYYELAAQGEDYIRNNTPSQSSIASNHSNTSPNTNTASQQIQVRLPSIDLPTFNGRYEDWFTFSETFIALIHNNESLNDVQRFHYLRSALKGDASQVILSLELTSSNYSVAWSLLEGRYKNKKLIIQKHVKSLFDLSPVEKNTGTSLRQLLDGVLKHVRALKALGQPTDSWDTLLVHIVTSKLNANIQREWDISIKLDELPSLQELIDFLQHRCQTLETSKSSDRTQTTASIPNNNSFHKRPKQACFVTQKTHCRICNGPHVITQCKKLLESDSSEQNKLIKVAGLCFNCLRPGHTVAQCRSGNCKKCPAKHNTLLHDSRQDSSKKHESSLETPTRTSCHSMAQHTQVVLSTAVVDVIGPHGQTLKCRALIDNGSQSCFMTENIAQTLRLPKARQTMSISGIDQCSVKVNGIVEATIKSCVSTFKVHMSFLVVPKITGRLPTHQLNVNAFKIPKHVVLADPLFDTPGRIDLLLGQELFFDLLCIGQIRTTGLPTIQKTRLGWIVGGRYETKESMKNTVCHLSTVEERVDKQLQQFWQLEEQTSRAHLTAEELRCEAHYEANTRRDITGKYVVSMPLRGEPSELGESKELAVKRLEQVERRLARNPDLRNSYTNFMNEYIQLGHMEEDKAQPQQPYKCKDPEYFLPHHPVIKEDSSTTKVRVVFDASAKTTSGISLNDMQLVGPVVQSDLFSIMVRFRMFTYVMTADLEKMYRQIVIDQSQTNLLKIVWRDNPTMPIKTYKLQTITYGTASAPYLATRTLNQLATDEGASCPEAARIVKSDFYVDDLLTGVHSIEEGRQLQRELIVLLAKGHFNLRKWNSNSLELLSHLPEEILERKPQEFTTTTDSTKKTLGLWWDAEQDEFVYKHLPPQNKPSTRLTKRIILSEIARLFDPLGLVSPVVVRAKIQLQELWKLHLGWDESLPMHLHTQWTQFLACLNDLNLIAIKRQNTLSHVNTEFEIHGFSDASEKAYGAAVYLKHQDSNGKVKVSLMCSKSRVAPLKTVSLPRLELCAALLLCELMSQVLKALNLGSDKITYWSDSTVVLAWIKAEPARWTTFVANRVTKIQEATGQGEWKHVNTDDNPADLISRGARANSLADSSLWWEGPSWLKFDREYWPADRNQNNTLQNLPEEKPLKLSSLTCTENHENAIKKVINKYSSFNKIIRVIAYCTRFITNLLNKNEARISGQLTLEEVQRSKVKVLRYVQCDEFPSELKELKKGRSVSKGQLASLAPFLDKDGLIRVGGRINQSRLNYDSKHQILLPKGHKITEMIASEEHVRQLHCGPQQLLYTLRQQYWTNNGRNLARKIVHKCVQCFKAKPKVAQQMMGELPASRVNPARAFLHTGVDYCGPFLIKQSKRRHASTTKAYISVFVCLATKAVHIELVSSLTTEAFLAALRRFIARRGLPQRVSSDNGKTFVGAKRELQELREFLRNEATSLVKSAAEEGITWEFIPPYSPHMGGIWEAAVKSLKHHLKRIVGSVNLSFEELSTIVTQVEAVLNSRPLTPMSNDPSDLGVLSPAHFLAGGPLTALPEPSLMDLPERRLSRWQRLQQLLQHFWERWSNEYLCSLQQRNKWKTPSPGLSVGTLVLLKEDNTPPLTWPMGRITFLHPGRDGLTRVASVKTVSGEVKRSVVKLCPLPLEN